jgi:hypothetical protein
VQVKATLEHLHKQENCVLEYWSHRKKKLDQCQQFVLFERSAKQVGISSYSSSCMVSFLCLGPGVDS